MQKYFYLNKRKCGFVSQRKINLFVWLLQGLLVFPQKGKYVFVFQSKTESFGLLPQVNQTC